MGEYYSNRRILPGGYVILHDVACMPKLALLARHLNVLISHCTEIIYQGEY